MGRSLAKEEAELLSYNPSPVLGGGKRKLAHERKEKQQHTRGKREF